MRRLPGKDGNSSKLDMDVIETLETNIQFTQCHCLNTNLILSVSPILFSVTTYRINNIIKHIKKNAELVERLLAFITEGDSSGS